MADHDSDAVLVPLHLEAFVLNPDVCNTGAENDNGCRIVPITQPNYTFLRLDDYLIQSDVQRHADLHNTAPAEKNTRMVDLGKYPPLPRRNRHGVYVHWTLPRFYRSGVSADKSSESGDRAKRDRLRRGIQGDDTTNPQYLQPPTRWVVVRKLDMSSIKPETAQKKFREYEAFVVDSDYLWNLKDIPLDYDLQVDVSPFVMDMPQTEGHKDDYITQQAEVFIGRKTPLEEYMEPPSAKSANISLLRSGNQLFADFQIHNGNVFSILDNFKYTDDQSQTQYINGATASYYLFGWHSKPETDPFLDPENNEKHSDRLGALFMMLKETRDKKVTDAWKESKVPTRLCCHGALYDVKWDHSSKPPKVPADEFSATFRDQKLPSISVGPSPMDALLSYCTSRNHKETNEVVEKLEEDILALESLLHARDDGVEGQREAKDQVYNWNFNRSPGGTHYTLKLDNAGDPTAEPDRKLLDKLDALNECQLLIDSSQRTIQQYRWDMFSFWWKYMSDVTNKGKDGNDHNLKIEIDALAGRIEDLNSRINTLQDALNKDREALATTTATSAAASFYRARDPTVLIGGIDSGWQFDFTDPVKVRIPPQVVVQTTAPPEPYTKLVARTKAIVGAKPLEDAVEKLFSEFLELASRTTNMAPLPEGQTYPQFHDEINDKMPNEDKKIWRDRWNDRQPWFPLYAEWEVEYTHVPFEHWQLDEQTARLSEGKKIRYGVEVKSGKPLYEELTKDQKADVRILSGRSLVLPQPSFSLKAKVTQLFQDTPPQIMKKYLEEHPMPTDPQYLIDNIGKLSYLSFSMAGLYNGLVTLAEGAHVKPEIQGGGYGDDVVKAAVFPSVGLTSSSIKLIAGNSAVTPYASLANFDSKVNCPFKPITHGQFRFRRMNIIDKFGQALMAIDPKPRPQGLPPLYPCISDYYEPQLVGETHIANTVVKDDEGLCEFIQLPPQINQPARLNGCFVKTAPAGGKAHWEPVNEWDNPIFGYIVVNYPDMGIHIFLQDGTFYREVRFGGPNGTQAQPKWEPFAPDDKDHGPTAQLDHLIDRLSDPNDKTYMAEFWQMVAGAMDKLAPAPDAYSQFLASITGKPLALANMGWSVELDGPPYTNQSTKSEVKDPNTKVTDYALQVKLGDKEREYDGLVGYFEALTEPKPNDELNLDTMNTYFQQDTTAKKHLKIISKDNYPKFHPFWVDPFPGDKPIDTKTYADLRNHELHVFGAILDPFTPVHGFSSFLPTVSLQLPAWTWQKPMKAMTAFFHAGPLNLAVDVKDYNPARKLTMKNMTDVPPDNLPLPALSVGEWSWLQPYVEKVASETAGDDDDPPIPAYNTYGIEKKGNIMNPGFEKGPYTAVEGFLQLRRPIAEGKPTAKPAA